jgi:hypothetical protein
VIARRDAEIEARYRELAALELHMVRWSLSWKLKSLWRNVVGQRDAAGPDPSKRAALKVGDTEIHRATG